MRLREALLAALAAVTLSSPAAHAQTDVAAPAITASAVRAAASAVEADPLLPGSHTTQTLRLKRTDAKKKVDKDDPDGLRWWKTLLENLSGGLRVAMWIVCAALLIGVVLRLREWVMARNPGRDKLGAVPPTHVGSLDIRPESLPDDIGAAARALWQRGTPRAALSLLYRGALSRLVHHHDVPIRAASTEQDCVALAEPRLSSAAHVFLAQLVAGWQTVAYAGRELPPEAFEQLCTEFDARLTSGARP